MGTEIEKYGWVNALRGYAILLVVFVHAGQHYAMFNHMQVLTHVGDLGVQLFFILSSFTLFNSYSKRRMYEDGFVKRGFFIRRFFRIAPYYYFAGLLYVAYAVLVSHESINAAGLVASFTFTNGLYLPAINYLPPGGWSVGVEMLFYVTIPVLFKYLDTLKKTVVFLVVSIIASNLMNLGLYYIITTIFHHDWIMTRGLALYFWFPNQFPVFVFGIALFFVFRNGRISKRAGTVLLWLSITAFLALALFKFDLAYPAYFFQREYVYAAVFTAFAIGAFASGSRLFSNALLQRIGTVSFSMYLNHFIVLYVMSWLVHMAAFLLIGKFGVPEPLLKNNAFFLLLYVLTAAAAFGLSTVTYRYIEKKGMELGENIIKILSKSTGTVAAVESIPGPGQAPVHEPPRAQ